jgi:predicted transglutaminase-like cysteine proteinase
MKNIPVTFQPRKMWEGTKMKQGLLKSFGSILISMCMASQAFASLNRDPLESFSFFSRNQFFSERGPVLAPMGHVFFCLKNPDACKVSPTITAQIAVEPTTMVLLRRVNLEVNHAIIPQNDIKTEGFSDQWTVSPKRGDCEDYALTKQKRLIELGLPASALRLAIARTPQGEGHAVLIVRTQSGDFILDNRFGAILTRQSSDLTWESIQSAENPKFWLAV